MFSFFLRLIYLEELKLPVVGFDFWFVVLEGGIDGQVNRRDGLTSVVFVNQA